MILVLLHELQHKLQVEINWVSCSSLLALQDSGPGHLNLPLHVFTALTHPSYLGFHSKMLLCVSISFEVTNSNLLLTVWPLCFKEVYILGSELPFLLFNFHYSILGTILIHLNSYVRHAYTAKKDLLFDKCISHQNCNCWHGFMGWYLLE